MIIKRGRHTFWGIHEVRKGIWSFFLDLLAGQTNNDNMDLFVCVFSSSEEPCKKRQENECALMYTIVQRPFAINTL